MIMICVYTLLTSSMIFVYTLLTSSMIFVYTLLTSSMKVRQQSFMVCL